jgi:hypothetical protein
MDKIKNKLIILCNNPSDINEHLPTLYKYAKECESIFETGVRGVISSYALLYGLLNNKSKQKRILLNDIDTCNIDELLSYTKNLDINLTYKWCNNLELEFDDRYDLTFIDTWHVYGQLKRELDKFSKITNKYIIMHDTTVDGIYGETYRFPDILDPVKQSEETGIPVHEILKGLWPAIEEFLENNNEWKLKKRYTNNNGLTILEKVIL